MAKAALVSKIMYPESLDDDSAQNQLELWIIALISVIDTLFKALTQ